jgi:hypothetical protein
MRAPLPPLRRVARVAQSWDALSTLALVVIAFAVVELFAGALKVGVTVDEPIHLDRTEAWLKNGWYVPTYWQKDGEPDPETEFSTPYVYGPATAAIGHAANVLLDNEPRDDVSPSADAYRVRHVTIALIALLCVAAVGIGTRLLTGSRAVGLWAAAGLLAVPRFTGHAFFNPKDIPATTGYTLITVALLFALYEEPGRPPGWTRRIAVAATVAAGFAIAAGTRLSLLLPLLAMPAAYAVLRLGQWRLSGIGHDRGTDIAVAAGTALGYLTIVALYPNVGLKPLTLIGESIANSADYFYSGHTLTAGSLLSEHAPFWYLPAWVGGTYPLLLGALAALGALAGLRTLARARGSLWSRRELGLVLVLQQALLLPLAAIVGGGILYDGLRQHLYVLPALAILAGVGAGWLLSWGDSSGASKGRQPAVIGFLALALIVPMAAQTILFPYNYTYVNPVAAIGGVNDRWEADYWWASIPEAISHVPHEVKLFCTTELETPSTDPGYEADLDECTGDRFEAGVQQLGTDVSPEAAADPEGVWVLGRKREAAQPPPYCDEAGNVTRWMWGEEVVMSFVLRCAPGAAMAAATDEDE